MLLPAGRGPDIGGGWFVRECGKLPRRHAFRRFRRSRRRGDIPRGTAGVSLLAPTPPDTGLKPLPFAVTPLPPGCRAGCGRRRLHGSGWCLTASRCFLNGLVARLARMVRRSYRPLPSRTRISPWKDRNLRIHPAQACSVLGDKSRAVILRCSASRRLRRGRGPGSGSRTSWRRDEESTLGTRNSLFVGYVAAHVSLQWIARAFLQ